MTVCNQFRPGRARPPPRAGRAPRPWHAQRGWAQALAGRPPTRRAPRYPWPRYSRPTPRAVCPSRRPTMPRRAIRSCECGCRTGQTSGRALGGARSTGVAAAAPASPTGRRSRCSRCRCSRWTRARTLAAVPPRSARPTGRAGPACARSKAQPARRRQRSRRRFSSSPASWQPRSSHRHERFHCAGYSRRTTWTHRPTQPPRRGRRPGGTP
mmetsp:Transcript_41564/g.110839  ORF Transcript_41564/g.110839 Transcript_41564/m.110839 type:complete len:211 (-) Transcript_41564:145-777(-)